VRFLGFALLTVGLLLPEMAEQQAAPEKKSADFFPMAVWYGGGKARAPMLAPDPKNQRQIWRTDLEKIRELGFNAIRCWVDWATAEPQQGQFNFDTIDVLAGLAEEVGLKVIIQVYADSAPDWVGKKYPDSHFIAISGEVMPSESAPGFCFDHPGVRAALLGFFTALAERVKHSPAFFAWDLWSEPHVINWASATYMTSPEFCFCPYTQARFQEWLKKKHGSLEVLNKSWYRRFTQWSEVEPPRLSTILSYTDYLDWRFFIISKLAEDLRSRYETVKRVVPDRIATSHAAAPSLFTSPLDGDGDPDDWLMAQQVDYWGTSFYPKHSFPVGRDAAWRGALLDFSRSSGYSRANGFWIGELQAGFGTVGLHLSSTVTPQDIKVWTWSTLARGAKAISTYAWYPMSSGYESGGFGLINLDGSITERARQAGQIARIVAKNQDLFLRANPTAAEVAVVYNSLSYLVGGRRASSGAGAQKEFAGIERNSMLGIYRALFPSNVPVDFIHITEIAQGKAGRYKLVLLPYPLMISEAAAKGLADYVRNGGALMTEARLAWNDERGYAKEIIPGFDLHLITGCRETSVQQTASGKAEMEIVSQDQSIPRLKPGDRLSGGILAEVLEPSSPKARVIARFADGTPAMIASVHGKGKTLVAGSFLGMLYESDRSPNLANFFNGLLDWAGVSRPVELSAISHEHSIEVRTMEAGPEKLVFIFNHGSTTHEASVRIKVPADSYTARDLVKEEAVTAPYVRDGIVLRKQLTPNDVWVLRLSTK
jgi:beta-galactosidase